MDGHSVHCSRRVRTSVAAHADQIELHFLSPHSPELNPDELVNQPLAKACQSWQGALASSAS
ncbi:transposase [Streptomyces yaanensis]|uniref:Transposase n=1 Tax=Streptomyces yaanensis TaxID=1142239 RepID=A0ABV7SFJ8_9ACTN